MPTPSTVPPAYTIRRMGNAWALDRDGAEVAHGTGWRTYEALSTMCDLLADTQADAATYRAELGQCVEAARLMDEWIAAKRGEVNV